MKTKLNEITMIMSNGAQYGANLENCYIDDTVSIGKGTKIWPGVTVAEGAVIGKNCELGKGSTIVGMITLGDNVKIWHHVQITGTGFIGHNCVVKSDIENPRMGKNCKVLTYA